MGVRPESPNSADGFHDLVLIGGGGGDSGERGAELWLAAAGRGGRADAPAIGNGRPCLRKYF
eukprot:scaffold53435_cov28-Tisochrysis_lutea.AAC.1